MKDVFTHSDLVKQAMRAVDRVLRVFERNPALVDVLLKVQVVPPGEEPLRCHLQFRPSYVPPIFRLVYWGDTRWNTKWDAMTRVHKLHIAINAAMAHDPAQNAYHLNEEEVRSMGIVLPFLHPICIATDRYFTHNSQ